MAPRSETPDTRSSGALLYSSISIAIKAFQHTLSPTASYDTNSPSEIFAAESFDLSRAWIAAHDNFAALIAYTFRPTSLAIPGLQYTHTSSQRHCEYAHPAHMGNIFYT
jgi:hypothetical protein